MRRAAPDPADEPGAGRPPARGDARRGTGARGATGTDTPPEPVIDTRTRGNTNGHTNGHTNGTNVDGPLAPNGAEFVAPGDAPARDLILRLLTAVKEL